MENQLSDVEKAEYIDRMKCCIDEYSDDIEALHVKADNILLEIVERVGLQEVADLFRDADKYYA